MLDGRLHTMHILFCMKLPWAKHRIVHCEIKCAFASISNSTLPSVSICVLLLLCLFGTGNVRGGPINFEVPRFGTARYNGSVAYIQQQQLGDIETSGGHKIPGAIGFPMIPQPAAESYPVEPCPTTELFNSGIDFHHVENQVTAKLFAGNLSKNPGDCPYHGRSVSCPDEGTPPLVNNWDCRLLSQLQILSV
jgi:hypothetical protein